MDGGSIAGTLFIVFLVLKLTHTITWSWWWITSPLWIDAVGSLVIILLVTIFGFAGFGLLKRSSTKR